MDKACESGNSNEHGKTMEGKMNTRVCEFGTCKRDDSTGSKLQSVEISLPFEVTVCCSNPIVDLLHKVLENCDMDENIIFSPLSIAIAMGMVKAGARGNTRDQIEQLFNQRYMTTVINTMGQIKNLPDDQLLTFNSANRTWIADFLSTRLMVEYSRTLNEDYSASIDSVDFTAVGERIQEINDWITETTHGMINNMVNELSIKPNTRLLLANAIYFKGKWKTEFEPSQTTTAAFHLNESKSVQADFMYQEEEHGYAKHESATIIRLAYQGELPLYMYIILPHEVEGAKLLERDFQKLEGQCTFEATPLEMINLYIPKFRIEQSFNLVDILSDLGIKDLFIGGVSDLSGMIENKNDLYTSDMLHRAVIEVNEEGAEVAAATVTDMVDGPYMSHTESREVRCDKPFLFLIKLDEQVIFLGRVSDPTKLQNGDGMGMET